MSSHSLRPSRKYSYSPASRRAADDPHTLHRTASDKRTRNPPPQQHYICTQHPRKSAISTTSSATTTTTSSKRKHKMPQAPQNPQHDQLYYFFPEMLEPTKQMELEAQPWMMATVIEDDDLMFGGKSLSAWYEEDRRRYSLGEDGAPTHRYDEEEERRGRQRDRHYYHRPSHKSSRKSNHAQIQEKKQ